MTSLQTFTASRLVTKRRRKLWREMKTKVSSDWNWTQSNSYYSHNKTHVCTQHNTAYTTHSHGPPCQSVPTPLDVILHIWQWLEKTDNSLDAMRMALKKIPHVMGTFPRKCSHLFGPFCVYTTICNAPDFVFWSWSCIASKQTGCDLNVLQNQHGYDQHIMINYLIWSRVV